MNHDASEPRPGAQNTPRIRRRAASNTRRNKPQLNQEQQALIEELGTIALRERPRMRRRIEKARSRSAFEAIRADLAKARSAVEQCDAAIPAITFPEDLPVSQHHDELLQAIKDHQVVIVAGETGSGKTTQIPKLCLELGRGRHGLIGHTQPRRLAARTVAERIASELDQNIGESVGYAIRFDDRVSPTTAIKLMTDGILLAEMQRDRWLMQYDTIIIDEAHERSLNIDFLLGYLKQLLPRRPDLKVIITSATIDPERFARHFADADGNPAPIVEVSGRTYPVTVLYRPLQQEIDGKLSDVDPLDGLVAALSELMAHGPGDILCFFAGEADIRDAMEHIEAQRWRNVEVTPLFGRLSNAEQHRVFKDHPGRRIVLATNIAETSLTVPGIRYVVDTGLARISRYSTRTKVQRLPIEPISQASAQQRSGRCGRVADGVAIRLYSELDFASRPAFTDPEILRTNLASVMLQMASLRLGAIEDFPFLEAPDTKAIRDGLMLLHELGALKQREDPNGEPRLTGVGKQLARIPLDPRLARMLVEAHRLGCLREAYVVVAALTVQDVRERPLDQQAQADQLHARFRQPISDFLTYLKLWEYLQDTKKELSGNAFRKRMKAEMLHVLRIREWFDLVRQLRSIGETMDWQETGTWGMPGDPDQLHQALLAGLLSHIGIYDAESRQYLGARTTKFSIFPGSGLAKKRPQFVMAAELVETSKLWARDVAAIDPGWVEQIASDLLRHQYSEPFWSSKRGCAMAHQRSTLYGVPVVADRLVNYAKVDADAARAMFLREALVEGNWTTHHEFFTHNRRQLEEATMLEEKARRRDIVVDEETLYAFYDARVPQEVTNAATFDRWWKRHRQQRPELLHFDPAALVNDQAQGVTEEQFPDTWHQGSIQLQLSYQFEPGAPRDGVTVHIPLPLLRTIEAPPFEWLVPGLREELVTALIRTLPKGLRKTVVPAPAFAERAVPKLVAHSAPLREQLAAALQELGGRGIEASDFRQSLLPDHLRITFAAVDRRGSIVDTDKDLAQLQQRRAQEVDRSVAKVASQQPKKAQAWTKDTLGTLDDQLTTTVDGQQVATYPTLVATSEGVATKVVATQAEAEATLTTTTITLLSRACQLSQQKMLNGLPLQHRVAIEHYPHGAAQGMILDAKIAAIKTLLQQHGGPVRDPDAYARLERTIVPEVAAMVRRTLVELAPGLVKYLSAQQQLKDWTGPAIEDIEQSLASMLPAHAITRYGVDQLRHLGRYAEAALIRLDDMQYDPDRDADRQHCINQLEAELRHRLPAPAHKAAAVQWMIQELRVSLFAQRLGTAQKVSERKIRKAIQAL